MAKLEHPTTHSELCSFHGLCDVFRRFVLIFAYLVAPLDNKSGKERPKQLGPLDEKESVAAVPIKEALLSTPVLTLPRIEGRHVLNTNVCQKQIGCVHV